MLTDTQWGRLEPLVEQCRPKGKTPPQGHRLAVFCFLGRSLERGCGRIGPGQELVETALGMAVDDAADHVGQVGPGFDADKLASLNQRRNHRPVRGSAVRAREESIFPGQSNLLVILPISGRTSWSIIAGIPSTGVAFASAAASSVAPGGSCRSKRSPASSRLWRRGCSIRSPAQAWRSAPAGYRWTRSSNCIDSSASADLGEAPRTT